MLKKSLALVAIAGMMASPLAFAQAPEDSTSTAPATTGGVASGGSATGGLAGALGVSTTTLVVGVTSIVVLGVAISAADSSGSGATGTR